MRIERGWGAEMCSYWYVLYLCLQAYIKVIWSGPATYLYLPHPTERRFLASESQFSRPSLGLRLIQQQEVTGEIRHRWP